MDYLILFLVQVGTTALFSLVFVCILLSCACLCCNEEFTQDDLSIKVLTTILPANLLKLRFVSSKKQIILLYCDLRVLNFKKAVIYLHYLIFNGLICASSVAASISIKSSRGCPFDAVVNDNSDWNCVFNSNQTTFSCQDHFKTMFNESITAKQIPMKDVFCIKPNYDLGTKLALVYATYNFYFIVLSFMEWLNRKFIACFGALCGRSNEEHKNLLENRSKSGKKCCTWEKIIPGIMFVIITALTISLLIFYEFGPVDASTSLLGGINIMRYLFPLMIVQLGVLFTPSHADYGLEYMECAEPNQSEE